MAKKHSALRVTVGAAVAALVMTATVPSVAMAQGGTADGYPTWSEVRAAQASESAKQAELDRLQQALSRAQNEAAVASQRAVDALQASKDAADALATAQTRETEIQAKLDADSKHVDDTSNSLAQVVSYMYRGSGGDMTSQVLFDSDPQEFIHRYGAATQVSETVSERLARALQSVNAEKQLREQSTAARTTREQLSAAASQAAKDAEDSQRAADNAVATATKNSDTVYEQLALLRGTTANVEREYQRGVQVAAQVAAAAAGQSPNNQNSGGSSGSGGSGGSGSGAGSSGNSNIGGGVVVDAADAKAYATSRMSAYGWGGDQMSCLIPLWNGESNWRADALNPYSGAYGIPQSLPAEKMSAAGADWRTNGRTQVEWGLSYIRSAYGSPCRAWEKWQARSPHWY